jgi:hypothetical protein
VGLVRGQYTPLLGHLKDLDALSNGIGHKEIIGLDLLELCQYPPHSAFAHGWPY